MDISMIKFSAEGLVPAIVQEEHGQVLMLAYMNKEALEKSLSSGFVWFYDKGCKEVKRHGADNGNIARVKEISYDCQGKALLVRVHQTGTACHTGTYSCFSGRRIGGNGKELAPLLQEKHNSLTGVVNDLYEVIKESQLQELKDKALQTAKDKNAQNYFAAKEDEILQKLGTASVKTLLAAKNKNEEKLTDEMSSLLYYCLALLAYHKLTPQDLFAALYRKQEAMRKAKSAEIVKTEQ